MTIHKKYNNKSKQPPHYATTSAGQGEEIMAEPFEKQAENFNHNGGYSIEVVKEASIDKLPRGAIRQGNIITVSNGKAFQLPTGGLYLLSLGKSFDIKACMIKAIYKDSGDLLWKNEDYDTMD